jgi:multiple sugar transport system permease protein
MATAEATLARPRARRRSGISQRRLALFMVSPSLVVIAIVAAYPIAYAIWLSLHQYSVIHPGLSRWVGVDNYRDALTSGAFWSSVRMTFVFTAISVSLELVIGMGMAMVMHTAFRGRSILRAAVLVPWAILTVGTAMMWRSIVQPDVGFLNQLLQALHLPGAHTVWLAQNGYALAVLIFADVWKTAPFMALLLLAGLQVIPDELQDAAKVDGATAWQRFVRITLAAAGFGCDRVLHRQPAVPDPDDQCGDGGDHRSPDRARGHPPEADRGRPHGRRRQGLTIARRRSPILASSGCQAPRRSPRWPLARPR